MKTKSLKKTYPVCASCGTKTGWHFVQEEIPGHPQGLFDIYKAPVCKKCKCIDCIVKMKVEK